MNKPKQLEAINLKRFEDLYSTFDKGHNRTHILAVRNNAVRLAKTYAPEINHLAYLAATLHDIGLSKDRERHEIVGAEMVRNDKELNAKLSKKDLESVVHAVLEHRATKGSPQTTLAKIISDADRGADTTASALRRAYDFGKKNYLDLTDDQQVLRAGEHLLEKYGPEGPGRRTYFPETAKRLGEVYAPIIKAAREKDITNLRDLMHP